MILATIRASLGLKEELLRRRYRPGAKVMLACYHSGCSDFSIPAVLDHEQFVRWDFGGSERIQWNPEERVVLSFRLREEAACPNCRRKFVTAIVASGNGDPPIIIGYEAEGC